MPPLLEKGTECLQEEKGIPRLTHTTSRQHSQTTRAEVHPNGSLPTTKDLTTLGHIWDARTMLDTTNANQHWQEQANKHISSSTLETQILETGMAGIS